MRKLIFAVGFFALMGCAASKPELKTADHYEKQPTEPNRQATITKLENELRGWDEKSAKLKAASVGLRHEETWVNHTKAIDDIEGQSKAARVHLREMQASENLKEEVEARNLVIENLTTIEKIYRQIQAE